MPKRDRLFFFAILAAVFAVMLVLNLLTPMLADDYMYSFRFDTGARIASVGDIFPSLAAHAVTMNGRLVPHFFVQLFTLFPRAVFGIVNALMFMALLLGIYRLSVREGKSFDWMLLLTVSGAVFLFPPIFGQSFLWLAGSVNYLWCDTLMVWLLVPFADLVFRDRPLKSAWKAVVMTIGALLLGNMSENVSACAALMMGLCVLWRMLNHKKVFAWMAVTTAATLAGWLALMLVPANRASVARSSGGLNALAEHYQAALSMWISHGLWLSLVFIALFCYAVYAKANRDRLAFGMGLFLSSLICNFLMTASDYYPERAYTGSMLFLILAFAVLLSANLGIVHKKVLMPALACGLGLVMALQMLSTMPSAYNRYRLAQARVTEVCAARDAGVTDVTTFGIKGNTRFDAFYDLNELTTASDYFPNVYFAKYYGLNSVVVDRFE